MRRIAYFYLMKHDSDRVRVVVPDHAAYWQDLDPPGYVGGPMADRSSGLITFDSGSVEEAEELVAGDPFVRAELLEEAGSKNGVPSPGKPTGRDLRAAASRPPGP